MIGQDDLNRRFAYHQPSGDKAARHEYIRNLLGGVANRVDENCPDGREKSLAITHLEDAMMWANAAIAREKTGDA